ncbi:hypothetical protein [Pedobacter endophyticus]|uniref:HPt domain-containing protein n=1 Tax=Pedobacter endophyticus TaxID=2789740 RepID=A0A7S9KY18_9SPHI|nr:hypothetical protein [Pedobacter endophyticus]QPH38938.1 hypothetical protein IZT61_18020 [Pedobacter endophyticus]
MKIIDTPSNNPGDVNKRKHELQGSLGVFKLLASHLSKESELDERTLKILEMLI